MRALLLALLCAAGCFSKPEPPGGGVIGDAGGDGDARIITGGKRRVITVNTPPLEELMRFPLAVVIPSDSALGQAASDETHVAFATMTGEALDCEIVEYSAGIGALEAWVTIPVLPTTTYKFQLIYGNDVQSPCALTRHDVWSEYAGVWHFTDVLVGTTRDSTANALDLAARSGLAEESPAVIGLGLTFDSGSADGADVMCTPNKPAIAFDVRSFSYEIWVHPFALVGDYDIALNKGGQSEGSAGFDLELGRSDWSAWVRDGETGTNADYDYGSFTAQPEFFLNTWSHLVVVVDRAQSRMVLFLNGVIAYTDDSLDSDSVTGPTELCVGDSAAPSQGVFDEPRVHKVARSAAWVRTSYENLTALSFLTLAPP